MYRSGCYIHLPNVASCDTWGTFCSLIYGVAFHDPMNKGNVSFSPYLDQLIKGVVFPTTLYLTEQIVHAANVTNGYVSIIQT